MRTYLIHTKDGNKVFTTKDIIENAKAQEKAGINPAYKWYNHKTKTADETIPAGWLVWSTWEDGCCICYKRPDNTYGIIIGWQADFCFV